MEYLIRACETWDGPRGHYVYKYLPNVSRHEAEAEALELALSLLKPYKDEISHYAEYMAKKGFDYDNIFHSTMLESTYYELWVKE